MQWSSTIPISDKGMAVSIIKPHGKILNPPYTEDADHDNDNQKCNARII